MKYLKNWFAFKKQIQVLVVFLVLIISLQAAVEMDVLSAPWLGIQWGNEIGKFTVTNSTTNQIQVDGLRFNIPHSPQTLSDQTNSFSSCKPINDGNGSDRYELRIPDQDNGGLPMNVFNPGRVHKVSMSTSEIDEGDDWTAYSPQYLIKTGSLATKKINKDIEGLTLHQLDSISRLALFYDESLVVLDTLGIRGSKWGAGFVDTWYDQEKDEPLWQIQIGLPTDTINYWVEPKKFKPYEMDDRDTKYGKGPMYLMGAAMAQEYLNIDMQYLIATGFQESNAGLVKYKLQWVAGYTDANGKWVSGYNDLVPETVNYYNHNTNAAQTRGPMHFIESSYKSYVYEGYPKFFPFDAAYEPSPKYVTTPETGGCEMNSPQIANAYLLSSLYMWYTWQLVVAKLGQEALDFFETAPDREVAAKMVSWAWNKGFNGEFATFAANPDPAKVIDSDIDYVGFVWKGVDALEESNRNTVINGGSDSIYDPSLTLKDLEKLFFGEAGTPNSGILGTAGILHHFNLTQEKRVELWGEVDSAFNMLKGHAPSTQGTNLISYRYDYLAVLRIAKKFLDLSIPLPKIGEFKIWTTVTDVDSTDPSFDNSYPYLVQGSKSTDGNNNFLMIVNVEDNLCLPISDASYSVVEWTIDSNWVDWHSAKFISGDSLKAIYQLEISDATIKTVFSGKTGFGWVRVTDINFNSTVDTFSIAGVKYPYLNQSYIEDINGDGRGDQITVFLTKGKADGAENLDAYKNLKYSWPSNSSFINALSGSVSVTDSSLVITDKSLSSGDGLGAISFEYQTSPNNYSGDIIDKVGPVITLDGANYYKPTDPSFEDIIYIAFSEDIKDGLDNNKIYLIFYDAAGNPKEVAATNVEKVDSKNYKFTFPTGTIKDQVKVNIKSETNITDLKDNGAALNNQKVNIIVTDTDKLWLKSDKTDGTMFGLALAVTLTSNGTKIYYSIDGSNPSLTDANLFTSVINLTGTVSVASITVTAIAVADGFESDTASWIYYTQSLSDLIIYPAGKEFEDSLEITINLKDSWSGSKIYYSLDGTDPSDTNSSSVFLYDGTNFVIKDAVTVKAQAYASDALASNVAEETYTKIEKFQISSAAYFDENGDGAIDNVKIKFTEIVSAFPKKIIFTNPFSAETKIILSSDMSWLNGNPGTKTAVATLDFSYSGNTFWETAKLGKADDISFDATSFDVYDQVAPVIDIAYYKPGEIIDEVTLDRAEDTLAVVFSEELSRTITDSIPFSFMKFGTSDRYFFTLSHLSTNSNSVSFIVKNISDNSYEAQNGDSIQIDTSVNFPDKFGLKQSLFNNRLAPLVVSPKPYKLIISSLKPYAVKNRDDKNPLVTVKFLADLSSNRGELDCKILIFDLVGNIVARGSEFDQDENIKIDWLTEDSKSKYNIYWLLDNMNGRDVASGAYLMQIILTLPEGGAKFIENINIYIKR